MKAKAQKADAGIALELTLADAGAPPGISCVTICSTMSASRGAVPFLARAALAAATAGAVSAVATMACPGRGGGRKG